MCGDLEEDGGPTKLEEALYNSFIVHSRALIAREEHKQGKGDPIIGSLDKLFSDALSRCVTDAEKQNEDDRYQILSMQPLVFARLAGFLAAHCDLREDPLRKVIEAMMHGYAEAERIEPDHGHDHDHSTGHYGHSH